MMPSPRRTLSLVAALSLAAVATAAGTGETLAANKQSEIEKPGAKSLAQLLVEAQE